MNKKLQHTRLPHLGEERSEHSRVLAFMNNKGGCGKTSSGIATGIYLARAGHNVLFIDCDPQCNLSQRLGVPDDLFPDRRLSEFFSQIQEEGFLEWQMKLPIAIQFRYLYRLHGYEGKHGTIALMAGSQFAEDEAGTARKKLTNCMYLDYEQKQISKRFRAAVRKYLNYFDYVILDTAPALEGSLLCQLALQASDEVICPVDGLEAALGLQHVISWLDGMSSPTYGVIDKPNLTFALTKYHEDDNDELIAMSQGYPIQNAVFSALKDVLGSYVCNNGILEDKGKKNKVYQVYGRMNDYEALCEEIINKINKPRPNFFEKWDLKAANRLRAKLRKVEEISLKKKTPTFKNIVFQEKKPEKILELENVDLGSRHGESLGFDFE